MQGGHRALLTRWGLGLPAAGLARARWFYWAFSFAVSVTCVPAILLRAGEGLGVKATGLPALAVLIIVRFAEFRRGRLLPAWTEVPLAVPLAVAAIAAGPLAAGLGLFFTGCFFRAVYASTRRTVLATVGAVTLLGLCAWATVPHWQGTFASQAFGILAATVLTRVLVATLSRQNQLAEDNERLLTTVFDNLDVSVMVGPSAEAPAMMNRAARRLHDELGLPEAPRPWHETVAVYAGDGRTPLPPEQMPPARALRGERVREMPVVLGLEDGTQRHFSVNAAQFADGEETSRAVVTVQDVTAQRQAQAELAHVATHDPLTGLANRTLLTEAIQEAVALARHNAAAATVILLDLDGFKRINDSLGHAVGDQVLQIVADRLRSALRPEDLIARLGGDEFAALVSDSAVSTGLARRICEILGGPMTLDHSRLSISASVGLVRVPSDEDAGEVLAAADLAMYAAKAAGPGQVRVFHRGMRQALDERLLVQAELHEALVQEQFELHFQPYVNLETGTVTGTEALVRWRHPARGLVPPLEFIPIVEDTHMIVPLGRWILRAACSAAAAWQPADPAHLRTMSVNVSARQLEDPEIVDNVAEALSTSGLPAAALTLEITESALVDDSPIIQERLRSLKALGVLIAVDDFGTGYSSLSRLRTFPVDILKIDRSFVREIEGHAGNALVKAILALSDALQLDVVAEGVETAGQARALATLGCRTAQGYHFARPAPPFEMSWIAKALPV